jgi:plastocyanin
MVGSLRNSLKLVVCALGFNIAAAACGGGGDDGGTPPPSTTIAKDPSGSGDGQSGTVGQPLAEGIRVLVTEDGRPLAGATVAWSTTAAGASLAEASTTTDNSGAATVTWTLGTAAGPQTAQAALSGAAGSPVTFNATANAGAAAELSKFSGDEQQGQTNSELANPLVAKVSDEFGNGVAGVPVGWATTGATLSAAAVPTDASGNSAVRLTLGSTAGPITITAVAPALTGSPQTFRATAVVAGPTTADVNVVNNSFQPATLTVPAGTTVTWRWASTALQHNVVPVPPGTEPAPSGSPQDGPNTYEYEFNNPGTYRYLCAVHGASMSGVITVQ